MDATRTLNVITLSLILFLAGCFGLGDSAEAAEDHEHTPNAAPVLHAELMMNDMNGEVDFNLVDCTANNCTITSYHAAVDPDGDMMELGYDFDLDGVIDYQLTNHRGFTDLEIPRTEFVETVMQVSDVDIVPPNCIAGQRLILTETSTVSKVLTTIALIAVDSNDAASATLLTSVEMYDFSTSVSNSSENCGDSSFSFSSRDASGYMSSDGGDDLVHVAMTQGDGLSWILLKVSIVVDNGASMICDLEGYYADATSDCTFGKDNDDNYWNTYEEFTISEGSATDLCDGSDGGCDVDVTLTKVGVGNEDDLIMATFTVYADGSN